MTSQGAPRRREPRTLLEQLIWERNQTLTEFVEWAEEFARRHNEPGTLSERNLKRLISGRKPDGTRIGQPRAATARLLERIFDRPAEQLIDISITTPSDSERELRQRLETSRRVDSKVVKLLQEQLDATRILDRKLGAIATHEDVLQKVDQVRQLMNYSLYPATRNRLAALLSELGTLAGWQALDLGNLSDSWNYYELARHASRLSDDPAFEAHAEAEQAFILLDLTETKPAISILEGALRKAQRASPTLQAWLTAAHGEALACDANPSISANRFDKAASLLEEPTETSPFVMLDSVHLERWRGHALAKSARRDAVEVLRSSLSNLGSEFCRAETSLRVDLATALLFQGDREEAQHHIKRASDIAASIGSARQQRRIQSLTTTANLK